LWRKAAKHRCFAVSNEENDKNVDTVLVVAGHVDIVCVILTRLSAAGHLSAAA
jgi:hypothetical protein